MKLAPQTMALRKMPQGTDDPNPLSLSFLLRLFKRQQHTIVITLLVVGTLSTLLLSLREPRYTSTALLVLDRSVGELTNGKSDISEFKVDTEVEMLRAISIVELVASQLKSEETGPASAKQSDTAQEKAPATDAGDEDESIRSSSDELLDLQRRFRISRRGQTDIISIDATAATPERAAQLANLYAKVYLEEQVTAKLASTQRLEQAIEQRVKELKAELAQSGGQFGLRQLLSDNVARLNQIKRREGLIVPDLRLAAPALPIEKQAFPSRGLIMVLGWLLALAAALGIALYREREHILHALPVEKASLNDPAST